MAINYDYKSKRGERLMKQEAKRKAKFAQKNKPKEEVKMHNINKTITLDDITRQLMYDKQQFKDGYEKTKKNKI